LACQHISSGCVFAAFRHGAAGLMPVHATKRITGIATQKSKLFFSPVAERNNPALQRRRAPLGTNHARRGLTIS
jgi:hypothetical protein